MVVKMFSGKQVSRKPWNGVALPKCGFMKGKKAFGKINCWRQVDMKGCFRKTLVTEYLTGPSQYNHITLKWDGA